MAKKTRRPPPDRPRDAGRFNQRPWATKSPEAKLPANMKGALGRRSTARVTLPPVWKDRT